MATIKINEVFTDEMIRATTGAVYNGSKGFTASKEAWEKRAVPAWPKSVMTPEDLEVKLTEIKNMASLAAGEAEKPYQAVIKVLEAGGEFGFSRTAAKALTGVLVVPDQYVVSGEKVLAKVDLIKFQADVGKLMSSVDRQWLKGAVVKQGSEQDFFHLVGQMLEVDESLTLIALLSARLLLGQEDRNTIDGHLTKVTVLLNRNGKMSQGIVRMGGFIGLACCNEVAAIKHFARFVVNPLLGQDVVERPITQKAGEAAAAFKEREETHKRRFSSYKAVMMDMKNQKGDFDKMSAESKLKIKNAVVEYILG